MSTYMMVSQPPPALPHTLPFISSPDSTNTTPSTTGPAPTNSTSSQIRPNYYHPPSSHQESHQDPTPHPRQSVHKQLSDSSNDHLSDQDGHNSDSARPMLETEGVVSSEVGAVPGILHQDLHPDGQPRRPMNAFMIFARHRRPAIQAKEPGLKTGEISKRLSHDWKNLPDEDKSHYLEQAKLLKDEFHNRFPEYVYKRRPNNTGKRRSSTSQQQLQPKYSSAPGGPSLMTTSNPPAHGPINGLPHPADMHHHHHHHANHSDMYGPPPHSHHQHQLAAHHQHPGASQPSRAPPPMALASPKVNGFYPPNPSSPRYHQIGLPPQLSNSTQPVRTSGVPHYASGPAHATIDGTNTHPSRAPSPPPAHNVNGMPSYMRLPQPINHPASHYSWFANDHYPTNHQHHHSVPTPVNGGRPSFYYPSWPPNGGENNTLQPDPSQDHTVNHNRASSYSAGTTALYRPPSPTSAERARQLSLPSHTLSPSTLTPTNESVYTKPESNSHGSSYGSATTGSTIVKTEPSHQLNGATEASYHNYSAGGNSTNGGPNDSRSYSTSSSPLGTSFNGPRGLFSSSNAPMSDNSAGTYDPHQSPMISDNTHPNPTNQPQPQRTSSVAY